MLRITAVEIKYDVAGLWTRCDSDANAIAVVICGFSTRLVSTAIVV